MPKRPSYAAKDYGYEADIIKKTLNANADEALDAEYDKLRGQQDFGACCLHPPCWTPPPAWPRFAAGRRCRAQAPNILRALLVLLPQTMRRRSRWMCGPSRMRRSRR